MSENHAFGTAPARAPAPQSGASATPQVAGGYAEARTPAVRRHKVFLTVWYAINFILIVSTLAAMYSIVWEFSTRRYLKGFSDAIIPATAAPEEKVAAIIDWMAHGPSRQASGPDLSSPDRDPTDTLNYNSLLRICGTATNAFINLADSGGLAARRLLLMDSNRITKHVVAEVLIDGRWIIVDPAFRTIPRGSDGELLTSHDLADPAIFSAAMRNVPGYNFIYTYDHTAHVRISRLRYAGLPLRKALDVLLPGWEDSTTMSLLLERSSLAAMVFALVMVFFLSLLRVLTRWYGEKRMGFHSIRIREQVRRACVAFLDTAT
jgi:Transglutaminase-like superfamily